MKMKPSGNKTVMKYSPLSTAISSALMALVLQTPALAEDITYNGTEAEYILLPPDPLNASMVSVMPTVSTSDNTVTITDTDRLVDSSSYNVPLKVYGAYTTNGDVTGNMVSITGGKVSSSVYGGYTADGDATDNTVIVSGGTAGSSVIGGFTSSGNAAGNTVTVSDGTINGNAFGGYSESGEVSGNTVDILGGSVDTGVYGGYVISGNATENIATVSAGTINGNVFGGYSESGDASGNIVNISGGTAGRVVYGGWSTNGNSTNNTVIVSGGTVGSYISGGYSASGETVGNSVQISGGYVNSFVRGGDASQAARENSVDISDGTVNGNVYGGYAINGDATDNTVTISGGTVSKIVYGGYTFYGNATGNAVYISGGSVAKSVYGGMATGTGNATGNTVIISGGSVGGNVYGGYTYTGDATDNSVYLKGGIITGTVYGGYSGNGGDVSDNVLYVANAGDTTITVGGLSGFSTLDFDLSNLSVNTTALTVTGIADLSDVTGVNITGVSDPSATITLISAATLKYDGNTITNINDVITSEYDFFTTVLSQRDNDLILSYSLRWILDSTDASGTFTLNEGKTFTLGTTLADNTSSNLSGWDGKSLIKKGEGTLILSADNTYTGTTTVSAGTLQLGNGGTVGSVAGDVINNAALVFNRSDDTTYSGTISGTGTLTQAGTGTLTLDGISTYTGATMVSSGTLKLGVKNAISSTSGVTVAEDATLNLGGNSQTVNSLNNSGTLLINDISADALSNVVVLYGDVINSGSVIINNCSTCAGQTLTVDGDWTGEGGTVSIGTVLGDDDSLTDKLVVTGAATGTTYVVVTNEGGAGAQTLEGIEVISTGSSTNNAFVQSGRIVAGSYEYYLQQGTASGTNTNNWYLTSSTSNTGTTTYRPERGSYASNLQAANTMFNTRLKDRQGGGVYTDPVTGLSYESSLWARAVGGHTEGSLSDGQSKYTANRFVFQIGGDVLTGSLSAEDEWHLGVMGGYGKQYSKTHNSLSGYNSRGEVWGYSTGLYGTWYQNAKDKTGLYVDSWLLYNWFDNVVKGDELAYEKYKSKGLTASLETGYTFHIGSYLTLEGMENNIYVTPQAQILWSGVQADDHTEQSGTQVQGRGSDNVQTRLGVRLSMTGQSHLNKGTLRQFEPFVEANWVYTDKEYGVRMGDDSAYVQGTRNMAEIKAGVEGRVSKNMSIWGHVVQTLGSDNYRDTQGVLGVKYAF